MKTNAFILVIAAYLILFISCKKDNNNDENPSTTPTVETSEVLNITSSSAISGGKVTSDGGAFVFERGICFSNSNNPTISDNVTIDGSGSGTFESLLSGLNPNTKYYVRAYARNNYGTSYGSSVQFNTSHALIEGTYYEVGQLGKHIQILDSGNLLTYHYISNIPQAYIAFDYRGKFYASGGTVGDWFEFLSSDGGSFWVVNQKDDNTIQIRRSQKGYSDAYSSGVTFVYSK